MPVTTERHGRILVVRMERPHKRNAVDAEMTAGLDRALNLLEDDPELWVGVLTGTPEAFSAGTDLVAGAGPPTDRGGEYGIARRHRSTPLLAAVEGSALGGGLELVLSCDLVVAARTAVFGLPEVRLGLVPNCGGLFRAPRMLPLNVARELLLTGDSLPAERAWSLGLVNTLTEPGGALAEALALAERICANSPAAVRAARHALDKAVVEADATGWRATESAWAQVTSHADSSEGVQAFLERRQPNWEGLSRSPASPPSDRTRSHDAMSNPTAQPRIRPVDDPDAEQAELLSKTLLTKDGRPLNLFATLAHHPRLLKRFNVLGGFFLSHGELPARERELVILRVAARTGSEYEYAQHVVIGQQVGLSAQEMEQVRGPLDVWPEDDRTLLRFVDEMIDSDGAAVTTWEALCSRYPDDQMMEMSLLVGFYRMLAGFLLVIGVQVEKPPAQ
jgi:enoyl-CoA hydratase